MPHRVVVVIGLGRGGDWLGVVVCAVLGAHKIRTTQEVRKVAV